MEGLEELRESAQKLSRDLARAGATMTDQEARFLVDNYYMLQEGRKRSNNQVRQMKNEPHELLSWFADNSGMLERQIVRALTSYTDAQVPVGTWLKANYGIGPVISAGLLAHIDIKVCPTVGHIWKFAGYDPTTKWLPKTKRPWNADLKTLCWKVGQSFMKFSGQEECSYGIAYRARKEYEVARNDRGDNAEAAAKALQEKTYKKDTDAYKAYIIGKLPPAHVDARARRWAVKLFLSHLHCVWYYAEFGKLPPKPYVIEHMGHVHFVKPQHTDIIPGLTEALASGV